MTREHTQAIPEVLEDGTVREPRYALGWRKPRPSPEGSVTLAGVTLPASMAPFTHGGISGTRLWVDPERRLVVVVLSNRWAVGQEPMGGSSPRSTRGGRPIPAPELRGRRPRPTRARPSRWARR